MSRVEIYTDGACRGNPGAGGWGAVLRYRGRERELYGGEPDTTNNRMELTAAIRALEALQRRCRVSRLHGFAVRSRWHHDLVADWKRRDWKTADRKPVKNQDLWQRLDALAAAHDVEWHWVRGHAGHPGERARGCAREPRHRRARQRPTGGPNWYPSGTVRQIVLDTETTGLELADGHRIIEIGCVELVHRRPTGRDWHRYLKPGPRSGPGRARRPRHHE